MKNKNTLQKNSEKVTESIQPAQAISGAAHVIEAKQAAPVSTTVSAASAMTSAASVDTATNSTSSTGNTARSASAAMPKPTFRAIDNAGDANDYVGTIRNGSFTNDNTPTMSGKSSPGAIITIYDNGVEIARVMAKSSGTWSYTPTLSEGRHKLSITATDKSGAVSGHSDVLIFNIQLDETKIAIEPPSFEILDHESEEIVSGISTTSTRPQIMGYEQVPGHIINVYNNKQLLGTATVEEDGSWLYIPNPALEDGQYSLTFSAAYGSVESEQTQPVVFTVDSNMNEPVDELVTEPVDELVTEPVVEPVTEPVVEPVTEPVVEPVTEPFVGPIQISRPIVSIEAIKTIHRGGGKDVEFTINSSEPGEINVKLIDANGKVLIYSNSDQGGGKFSHVVGMGSFVNTNYLPIGDFTYEIEVFDAKGNPSELLTGSFTTIPPAEPTFVINDDFGSTHGVVEDLGESDDRRPTLSGTIAPGHSVKIMDRGNVIGTAVADADGKWEFTPPADMALGIHFLNIVVTDTMNNFTPSETLVFNLVAPPPVVVIPETPLPPSFVPMVTKVTDSAGKEIGVNQEWANKPPTVYEGTGKPGALITVTLENWGATHARLTTTVNEDGTWRVENPDANHPDATSYRIFVTHDGKTIGNANGPNYLYVFNLDTTPPDMLEVTQAYVSQTVAAIVFYNEKIFVGGTFDLKIYNTAGELIHTQTQYYRGTTHIVPPTNLPDGNYRYEVTVTDQAGNTSPPAIGNLLVDKVAPWLNLVGMIDNDQTIIGYGEPMTTVNVRVSNGNYGSHTYSTKVGADGKWSVDLPEALVPGQYDIEARAYDNAGNISPTSNCYTGLPVSTPSGGVEVLTGASATLTSFNDMPLTPGPLISVGNGEYIQQLFTPDGQIAGVTFPTGNMGNLTVSVAGPEGVDVTAPDVPTYYLASDNVTVIGKAEPNSWVTFIDKSKWTRPELYETYRVQADAEGNWKVVTSATLQINYRFEAYATDAANNKSTTMPLWGDRDFSNNNPLLSVEAVDDQGIVLHTQTYRDADLCFTGSIMKETASVATSSPKLQGTTVPYGTVKIQLYHWTGKLDDGYDYVGRPVWAAVFQTLTATADANGNWQYNLPELNDGSYQYKVSAVGAHGGYTSEAHMLVIDSDFNPAAITVADLPDRLNAASDLTIRGTAAAHAIVKVLVTVADANNRGQVKTYTVEADAEGNWSVTPDRTMWNGVDGTVMKVEASTTNSNNQTYTALPMLALVDITPPPAPIIGIYQDPKTGIFYIGDQGGKLLRGSAITMTITDESGQVLQLTQSVNQWVPGAPSANYASGFTLGTMPMATDELSWGIQLPTNLVGNYTIVTTVTDPFGNVSQPTTYSSATDGAAKMAAVEASESVVADDVALVADAVEPAVVAETAVVTEAAAETPVETTAETVVETAEAAPLMLEDVLAAPVDLGLDSQAQALFEVPAAPAVSAEPVATSYTMAMPTVNDLLAQHEMTV